MSISETSHSSMGPRTDIGEHGSHPTDPQTHGRVKEGSYVTSTAKTATVIKRQAINEFKKMMCVRTNVFLLAAA
jgi:hypothetical protein